MKNNLKQKTNIRTKRGLLKIKFEKRIAEKKIEELKIVQAKEIAKIHRFAEFGRLSGGLFHDLVNPLTTVILNAHKIKQDCQKYPNFDSIKPDLEQVIKASQRMKEFINSVRKQISPQGNKKEFCLNQEIEEAIQVLNYKARKDQIQVSFFADEKITTNGDSIKFNQITTNLLSNAIDSYANSEKINKEIQINLKKQANIIELSVSDSGTGISDLVLKKIFNPFFTTKTKESNLGLGLPLIKKIIEEDFLGTIKVSSENGEGSNFTVNFPLT